MEAVKSEGVALLLSWWALDSFAGVYGANDGEEEEGARKRRYREGWVHMREGDGWVHGPMADERRRCRGQHIRGQHLSRCASAGQIVWRRGLRGAGRVQPSAQREKDCPAWESDRPLPPQSRTSPTVRFRSVSAPPSLISAATSSPPLILHSSPLRRSLVLSAVSPSSPTKFHRIHTASTFLSTPIPRCPSRPPRPQIRPPSGPWGHPPPLGGHVPSPVPLLRGVLRSSPTDGHSPLAQIYFIRTSRPSELRKRSFIPYSTRPINRDALPKHLTCPREHCNTNPSGSTANGLGVHSHTRWTNDPVVPRTLS